MLEPITHEAAVNDLVALATPVWSGLIASPMRTYMTINKPKFNRVAFFCTWGDNENRKLFSDMQGPSEMPPVSVAS